MPLLKQPVSVGEADRKWVPVETNRVFQLQAYRYGGVGKGVQTTFQLLALAKIVHAQPRRLNSGLNGNYRIITSVPVRYKPNRGGRRGFREDGEDAEEGMVQRWQVAESNNLVMAQDDMLILCHRLNALLTRMELKVTCLGMSEGYENVEVPSEVFEVLRLIARYEFTFESFIDLSAIVFEPSVIAHARRRKCW